MKKFTAFSLTFILVFALTVSSAFAESRTYVDSDGDVVTETRNEDGTVQLESSSFSSSSGNFSVFSTPPYWIANTNIYKTSGQVTSQYYVTGTARSWTSSDKIATYAIDKIAVTSRVYLNGGITGTASDTQSNSAIASATAWQSPYGPGTGTGNANFTFEESGYVSWYPTHDVSY